MSNASPSLQALYRSPGGGFYRSPGRSPGRRTFRAMENGALDMHEDHTIKSSIGGRLGGSIRASNQNLAKLMAKYDQEEGGVEEDFSKMADEESPLLGGATGVASPPLLVWIFPALACACAYAFYNIFIKKGSFSIHPILGGVLLQFVAAILGSLLLAAIVLSEDGHAAIHYDKNGVYWSCWAGLAGKYTPEHLFVTVVLGLVDIVPSPDPSNKRFHYNITVGTAEMLSFCVSGMGVQASQFIPIIIGGSVAVGACLGLLVLGEVLMMHGWFGVGLLVSGIALVATDPGDKVEEGGGEGGEEGSPPLIIWIGPALLCACAYALYNIFIKKGSASINPILGGVILQFVAAIFGSLLLVGLSIYENGISYLNFDGAGLFWSCMAGLAVGSAEMLSFVVSGTKGSSMIIDFVFLFSVDSSYDKLNIPLIFFFSGLGVQASQSIPIIIGGSVAVGALLGLIMLGETLMLQGWIGVFALMVGIGFVATDPGEKVAGH
jgi:bacterial/archaeal transporter family protein